ncbi:MAG: hypothetical protein QME48_03565 [bacterium]|uniref:Uncharacterized protein n=1 Tax=candidate division TA06 bacterium 34_109 TaxID=1635277 RepID=A0A124G0I1_UNCT6|nr:MAG: hypothetical protein XD76_1215 [candidate division TA06 bacterium 32_111]KUK87550.1 MAG: hypothetical protein XE03_0717 [candidate division TA06 bacterium 34_109]MDI6700290.1 hypothetical protein [bacterium]
MRKKIIFFVLLFVFLILVLVGIFLKQYDLIYNFGRFICFDCIGL